MVVCSPRYGKVIPIAFGNEDHEFGIWLYQRLSYEGFPVWAVHFDIGFGGGVGSSIGAAVDRAEPVLFVVSNTFDHYTLDLAIGKKSDLISILIDGAEIPPNLQHATSIDFRRDWELGLSKLIENLANRTYPPFIPRDGSDILKPDYGSYIRGGTISGGIALNIAVGSYLRAMQDMEQENVRAIAVQKLAKLRTQSGMILAALKDPSPEVRSAAALALARIDYRKAQSHLRIASLEDPSISVRLYAQIACLAFDAPKAILRLIDQLEPLGSLDSDLRCAITALKPQIAEFLDVIYANRRLSAGISYDMFISYARADAEKRALDLAEDLRNRGYLVWIDTELEPGTDDWVMAVTEAIQQSTLFICIVSEAVHRSAWVTREIQVARDFNKEIIPIKIHETRMHTSINTEQGIRGLGVFQDNPNSYGFLAVALEEKLERLQLAEQ